MRNLILDFGGKPEDLEILESGIVHGDLPADQQPIMSHRLTAIHRMYLNTTNNQIFPSNTHAVLDFMEEEIASDEEHHGKLNYDRSSERYARMAPDAYQKSSVAMALARMSMVLSSTDHHHQDNLVMDHPITVSDQVLIRTMRHPEMDDTYSPTPEGIHQDNTEV